MSLGGGTGGTGHLLSLSLPGLALACASLVAPIMISVFQH